MTLHLVKSKSKNANKVIAELNNVTKVFNNGETVIRDFNLSIQKSDFITLLGKSHKRATLVPTQLAPQQSPSEKQ